LESLIFDRKDTEDLAMKPCQPTSTGIAGLASPFASGSEGLLVGSLALIGKLKVAKMHTLA